MATEKPRFSLTVSEEMLKLIDDFRFEHRYNTRNEAVAALIEKGFKFDEQGQKEQRADD